MSFYIFHRHRVCLFDHVDLICSLYSWWEGFTSSSLATLPLGLNCGFISTSAYGSSTGGCFWICPGELVFASVSARCGSGVAAWVTVNSSPHPGVAPQSLNSSSQMLHLPGNLHTVRDIYGCSKDCLILIVFRLSQISCFTLSLKCFSSDSVARMWGSDPCFSSPTRQGGVTVLLTLLFFSLLPSSSWVLCGSVYLLPLVRYSCLLSAGVLHVFLCLKVYPWFIHGERSITCSATPVPSCSLSP